MQPTAPAIDTLLQVEPAGDLANALSRPVRIHTVKWQVGYADAKIDPWALFLNDPFIQSKIDNFAYLRGDLHVEIQVNGTPFHYGLMQVSYEPSNGYYPLTVGDVFKHSSLSHIQLDPSLSNTGSMVLPFIAPQNYMNILFSGGANLGVLYLEELVALSSASGTVDACTINVYAWMEDAKLHFPCVQNVATFTPQSKRGKKSSPPSASGGEMEEATTGVVSGPLASLSRWAGYFTTVPTLAPYAMATKSFADAGGGLAKLFGWSRPRNNTAPAPILRSIGGGFAACDSVDTSTSLAVHQNAELSVDPRLIGNGTDTDELAINNIAGKWAAVAVYDWEVADAEGHIIIEENVEPKMFMSWTPSGGSEVTFDNLSPLCFAALPFEYWRGGIEVKIQVVCSKYHRGRLRAQWVPQSAGSGGTVTNTSLNHVFDISEQVDHCFTIPYASLNGFQRVYPPSTLLTNPNGVFRLIVQNELVSPEAVNDAHIVVWVRGCADFKVAAPSDKIVDMSNFTLQSAKGDVTESNRKECVEHTFFDASESDSIYVAYMGDPVLSFRSLMKRYTWHTYLDSGVVTQTKDTTMTQIWSTPIYPQRPGRSTRASWNTPTTPYNAVANTVTGYLDQAFLAKRGSYRWKYRVRNISEADQLVGAGRLLPSSGYTPSTYGFGGTGQITLATGSAILESSLQRGKNSGFCSGNQGYEWFPNGDERYMEVELPFYSHYKYVNGTGDEIGVSGGAVHDEGISITTRIVNPTDADITIRPLGVDCWCAAGEDFTMSVWTGVPLIYYDQTYTGAKDPPQINGLYYGV